VVYQTGRELTAENAKFAKIIWSYAFVYFVVELYFASFSKNQRINEFNDSFF